MPFLSCSSASCMIILTLISLASSNKWGLISVSSSTTVLRDRRLSPGSSDGAHKIHNHYQQQLHAQYVLVTDSFIDHFISFLPEINNFSQIIRSHKICCQRGLIWLEAYQSGTPNTEVSTMLSQGRFNRNSATGSYQTSIRTNLQVTNILTNATHQIIKHSMPLQWHTGYMRVYNVIQNNGLSCKLFFPWSLSFSTEIVGFSWTSFISKSKLNSEPMKDQSYTRTNLNSSLCSRIKSILWVFLLNVLP